MTRSHVFAVAATLALAACSQEQGTSTAPSETAAVRAPASDVTPSSIGLEKIGGYAGGGSSASEISAFDEVSKRVFTVNGALGTVDVLDLKDPSNPRKIATIGVTAFGRSANSVATHKGVVAVAIEASDKQAPGTVAFYRATTLEPISSVQVGALPDMLQFSPSGKYVLVANEGEPNDAYTSDPEGSVSIIDASNVNVPTVQTAGFGQFNGQEASLRAAGVRIYGPGASAAQDFEPEYITVSDDETTAWVVLQENNALAIVDVPTATVTRVVPLGFKDHSLAGNGLDASDRDGPNSTGLVNIRPWPVFGMYQPDGIASYEANGQTYLVTANEGDTRAYPGFDEEARVSTLPLNTSIFTSAACGGTCSASARLGRLTVSRTLGRNPATGLYDALYVPGGRSFSIWSADGRLVWDSGDQFEQLTRSLGNVNFNANNTNNALDDRSDNKGPEPEGVAIGRLGEKTFAFIGFERVGGIVVYDVTVPQSPVYVTYLNTRSGASGDLGPEGVHFVPAVRSPSKEPLLIVSNEVSGTTAIYRIALQ